MQFVDLGQPSARSTRLGALAVFAWLALCVHVTGLLPLDAFNPLMSGAGCARPQLRYPIPSDVAPGLTFVFRDQRVQLRPGQPVIADGHPYQLVGVDEAKRLLMLEDRYGLMSIPLDTLDALVVPRVSRGKQVMLRFVGAVGGGIVGVALGLGVGAAAGDIGGAIAGCAIGGALGVGAGTTIAVLLTRRRKFRMNNDTWTVELGEVPSSAPVPTLLAPAAPATPLVPIAPPAPEQSVP